MPVRLVDVFSQEMVRGAPAIPAPPPPRTEWTFTDPSAGTNGFSAFAGVSGLGVRDGMLVGRSTSDTPLLHVERTTGLENQDQLHSIEVRIRVSAGANFSILPGASTVPIPPPQTLPGPGPVVFLMTTFGVTTPIVAGEEVRTYTLRSSLPIGASRIQHVYIKPTDVAGAEFAIESIRFIFRKEYLAGIEFQGMSEIYRESIVSRAPETIRIPTELPSRPSLDFAVGTVDDAPVTFRVSLGDDVLFEHTVTTPYRWEHRIIDLAAYAGRSAILSLSLDADQQGAIGVWGTPVVRQSAGADSGRPRGVIVLWTDTLRLDHLDVYGYERETAPNLKSMASEGVLFLNNVSQATWTKVSTPSLVTSLYPSTHGVKEFSDFLPASAVTLAEVYREAGYATVSFASNLFTGQFTNLHQGFEELHEDGSLPEIGSSKTSREFIDRFMRWLEAHEDVPFFALLHLYDPHDPFEPRPPYATLWADPEMKELHFIERIEIEAQIELPFTLPQKIAVGLGAQLDVERNVVLRGNRLDPDRCHRALRQPWDDAPRSAFARRCDLKVELRDAGRRLDRPHQTLEVTPERFRIAPHPLDRHPAIRVDDELRVGSIPEGVLEVVLHGVCDPRNLGAERSLRLGDVHESLFERERCCVGVEVRMRERFIDVVEPNALRRVVAITRLQTGDVSKAGRSREAAKDEDRVVPVKARQIERITFFIEGHELGKRLADLGCRLAEQLLAVALPESGCGQCGQHGEAETNSEKHHWNTPRYLSTMVAPTAHTVTSML